MDKLDIEESELITIITATYNADNYLDITAKSIRGLNYSKYEWIVIDGGSTDATMQIIINNNDIISRFLSEPDQGIYDAWNKGIALSKGKWIAFLGAGDTYLPNALTNYAEHIRSQAKKIDFVTSRVRLVDANGALLKAIGSKFEYKNHQNYMQIAHVGSLHRRDIFERFGLFSTNYTSSGDFEYFMRCGRMLNSSFMNIETVNMLAGGISGGYKAIFEAYKIKKMYGSKIFNSALQLTIALIKKFIRSKLYGY